MMKSQTLGLGLKLCLFTCWISYAPVFSFMYCCPYLCFISFLYLELNVLGEKFMDKLGVFHANQTSMCLNSHLNF